MPQTTKKTLRTLACASLGAMLLAPAAAHAQAAPLARAELNADHAGEAKLILTASAPGTDWQLAGHESAVLAVAVDGKAVKNVVTNNGAVPLDYDVALSRGST